MTISESEVARLVARALLSMQRQAWEQGTAAQAFLEMGETDTVVVMAREAALRQLPDGRLAMIGTPNASTDPGSNGEAVLLAAKVTGDEGLRQAADKQLEWFLRRAPTTADGTLYHITDLPQVWVDSFYMAPPFLAVAGHPAEAVKQIEGFRRLLWDPGKRLYHHIWDDSLGRFAREAFWGVGNGWAAAGITRVAAALPPEMEKDRQRLIAYAHEVLGGCLRYWRPDGLFHDVVDDPSTFIETNLTQQLAYTIYRHVAAGWLDSSYLQYADKMRAAAHQKVDRYGIVWGVCSSPHFDRPGYAPEGQAFFLLMEAAAARLEPRT